MCFWAGLGGCVKESSSDPSADETRVRVMIGVKGRAGLFGTNQFNDCAIRSIDVLAFDNTDRTFLYHTRATSIDPNYTYFDAFLRRRARNAAQFFMVLANLSEEVSALLPPLEYDLTTVSDVQDKLIFDFIHAHNPNDTTSDALTFGKSRFLPMWGMSDSFVLYFDGETITAPGGLAIPLLRSVATVTVKLDLPVGHADFKLKQVAIYNTPNKGYAIPHEDFYTKIVAGNPAILNVEAIHPSTVIGASYEKAYFNCENETGSVGQIYIGEKYNGRRYLPNQDETLPEEDLTWVLIQGEYDNSNKDTWYKLPFRNINGELLNVLRNHDYIFTITKVTGPGSMNEDGNDNSEIDADIFVSGWDDQSVDDMKDDSAGELRVSATKATLTQPGTAVTIWFWTNKGNASLSEKTSGNLNVDDIFYNLVGGDTSNFSFDSSTGEGWIKLVTDTSKPGVNSGGSVTHEIVLCAGTLRRVITVTVNLP